MLTKSRLRPTMVFRAAMALIIVASMVPMLPRLGFPMSDGRVGAIEGFMLGAVISCLVWTRRMQARAVAGRGPRRCDVVPQERG